VWGTIQYQGPGVFIAGGAGITPFIAILRSLEKEGKLEGNTLIFSNKTSRDIILNEEFERMLGNQFINTLTDEDHPDYDNRRIDKDFLKEKIRDFSRHFYVCGPPSFIEDITAALKELDAKTDSIVLEK
jgi:ferredoxin-NADP reductase